MRMLATITIASAFIAGIAYAQPQQPTDDEIKAAFSGKKIEWGTFGIADYKADGSYEYFNTGNGQTSRGKYTVANGTICVDFTSGQRRCDRIQRDKDGFLLITSRGDTVRGKIR